MSSLRFFAALSSDAVIIAAVFAAIFLAAVILFAVYLHKEGKKRREIEHYGDRAEAAVSEYLSRSFPDSAVFHNVYLKTPHGLTQIDHILVCRWGIYVIETKSHNGLIITGTKEWTQKYKDKTIRFFTPLRQNGIHCDAVRAALEGTPYSSQRVNGVVVFTSKNVRFAGSTEGVIRLDQLNDYVKTGIDADPADKKRRVAPITSRARRKYLDKSAVKEISSIIRKHSEKSRVKQRLHRERVRDYGIYKRRRRL